MKQNVLFFLDKIIENAFFLFKHNIDRKCVLLPKRVLYRIRLAVSVSSIIVKQCSLKSFLFCCHCAFSIAYVKHLYACCCCYQSSKFGTSEYFSHKNEYRWHMPFLYKTPSVEVSRNSRQSTLEAVAKF